LIRRVNDCLSFGPHNGEVVNRSGVPLQKTHGQGFTLIELSIALVIIGLLVGGVLVGQDLIRAAGVRATITQIEKYNQAANAFYGKYGYLPGDIPAAPAAQFGLAARGQYAGEGDGNGLIEGVASNGANQNCGYCLNAGETNLFWVDLGQVNLVEGRFTNNNFNELAISIPTTLFPSAKIGRGNLIYVWSQGATIMGSNPNGINYFGISTITSFGGWPVHGNAGLTPQEAYSMDSKVDDGLPQSGRVTAAYVNYDAFGNPQYGYAGGDYPLVPYTTATAGSSSTCFDNSATTNGTPGVAGAAQHYSLEISNGSNVSCALSFRMQAGD
jgi:prepilin-type N-terminal cleavage/methylation domain-containing protein